MLKELHCFEFCYVICSVCHRSVLVVFLGAVPLFSCSSHVPPFHGIAIVLPVFRCSASVLVFCQRSGVLSVFQYSASVLCSIVLCSGVLGFIVCPDEVASYSSVATSFLATVYAISAGLWIPLSYSYSSVFHFLPLHML